MFQLSIAFDIARVSDIIDITRGLSIKSFCLPVFTLNQFTIQSNSVTCLGSVSHAGKITLYFVIRFISNSNIRESHIHNCHFNSERQSTFAHQIIQISGVPRGEWGSGLPTFLKYCPRDFHKSVIKLIGKGVGKLFCSVRCCDVYEKYFD